MWSVSIIELAFPLPRTDALINLLPRLCDVSGRNPDLLVFAPLDFLLLRLDGS